MANDSTPDSVPSTDGELPGAHVEFDLDAALGVLSNAYRRRGLSYLLEDGKWVPADELYEHVADTVEPSGREPDVRAHVEAAFYHWHRPKLEDAELIEYDEESGAVRATENAVGLGGLIERGA